MKPLLMILAGCVICTAGAAHAEGAWSLSGIAAVSAGDQANPSLAWWGAVHHRVSESRWLGFEAGRHRWSASVGQNAVPAVQAPFSGLAHGQADLDHLSVSLRLQDWQPIRGADSYVAFCAGAYRQTGTTSTSSREVVRPGMSVTLGGAGSRGIRPNAEFRLDVVDTKPEPSTFVSVGLGLRALR